MITAVTPSTLSRALESVSAPGLAQFLSLVVAITFLVLLVETELVDETTSPSSRLLARGVRIGVLPLGFAFVVITAAFLLQIG